MAAIGSVHQGRLEKVLELIFPHAIGQQNARKTAAIKSPLTSAYLELDVYYPFPNPNPNPNPNLNLHGQYSHDGNDSNDGNGPRNHGIAFEFQDDYHYRDNSWYSHVPLHTVINKDYAKKEGLLQRGDTLVLVPCWWDGSIESLQSTIHFHRPDLCVTNNRKDIDAIPLNPPHDFFETTEIGGIEKLMLASFPSSAEMVDVTASNTWWLGEKYDGIRCYWDPNEKQMYSRHGYEMDVHQSCTRWFANCALDSEIWCGRGLFLDTQSLVQMSQQDINWSQLRVVCFDEASTRMKNKSFEKRYEFLIDNLRFDNLVAILASRFMCVNKIVLINTLQTLIEEGGEGIILRKPRSLYEGGRSTSLLKLKASRSDQEALVMEVEKNGDLFLQTPDGIFFAVPKVDYDLPRLPIKGDIVTFSHDFQTRRSIPSNPVVYRLRNDVTWEDVLQNASLPVRQFINEPHQNMQNFTAKPRGYWSYDKGRNMRDFLEGLAKRMGFDPLLPENWYSVSRQECMQYREVRTLVRYFGNSLIEALVTLFPEIGLEIPKFDSTPKNFWDNVQNRRELYERFAQAKGGNPLSPSFWYTINAEHLRKFKGGKSVVQYYKGFVESVIHLFPELKLQPTFFSQRTVKSWANVKARREFFSNFAASKGFDPLVPHNWYSVTTREFKHFQGYEAILNYYDGKLSECLMQLYPDIGLQKSRFNLLSYWNNAPHRRAAMEHFAMARGFDPRVSHHWYQHANSLNFSAFPETRSMLYYYNGKYITALIDLFPHLHLDPFHFVHIPQGYWESDIHRRKLFLSIASQRGFDALVPSNWYTVSSASLVHVKGASYVVNQYYNGSLTNALIHLFPDINLVESRFRNGRTKEWMEEKNRRWYLETLAKRKNFDPLKAEEWISFLRSQDSTRQDKIFLKIIANYKNTTCALSSLFPELDTSLFHLTTSDPCQTIDCVGT